MTRTLLALTTLALAGACAAPPTPPPSSAPAAAPSRPLPVSHAAESRPIGLPASRLLCGDRATSVPLASLGQTKQVAPVDVEVFPTAAEIAPGHRLRIAIQAFDVPHLAPSLPDAPSTLVPLTVRTGPLWPSVVTIPAVD